MTPIIDLHADLLGCIAYNRAGLTFESEEIRCSVPQLMEGGVKLQVLALGALTEEGSTKITQKQTQLYKELREKYGEKIASARDYTTGADPLHVMFALENASTIAEENEPIEACYERLDHICMLEDVMYISLTWNHENRFGGGNHTDVGLKRDGELLLDYLDGKKIAIDLSHTSDHLAYDILNYIDQTGIDVQPIASHSNMRAVKNVPRNLPDELVKELVRRRGIIGLNFLRKFIGNKASDILRHIEHAIKLGAEDHIAFAGDFYGGLDLDQFGIQKTIDSTFFDEYPDASHYQKLVKAVAEEFSEETALKFAVQNSEVFLGIR